LNTQFANRPAGRTDEGTLGYHGWKIVIVCFSSAVCAWGFGFYGHSVFLAELQKQHGWSSGLIATATTVYYFAGALIVAFVGDAVRALGPRNFLLLGLLALALSAASVPFLTAPWQLYAAYLLMAFGWAGTSLAAVVTILSLWFHDRLGMAISLALNGASTGSIIVTPMMVALTAWLGFRLAVPLTVLIMLTILVPMVLAWVRLPANPGGSSAAASRTIQSGGKLRAMSDIAFWRVALPFALGIAAQVGFIIHQVPILETSLGPVQASLAVALTGATAIAARVLLSFYIDRVDHRAVTVLLLLNQAVSLLVISISSNPVALFFCCATFGLAVGNLITLPSLIIRHTFPAPSFAMVSNLVTAVISLTYAAAPGVLGVVRDASQGYRWPLYVCIAAELLAALLVVLPGRRTPLPDAASG